MNGSEYVKARKILDVHKRLMGIQMNKSKFEPDVYDRLISELETELKNLKEEGEK